VILSFYACLVNKRPSISSQPRHCTADVSIQLHNLLDTARVKKRRCNPLLYCKHDTFSSLYSDGGRSKLDNDKNRTFGKYFSVISTQERASKPDTVTHDTLMASMAYSTWNRRPSGEKVFTPRSYSLLKFKTKKMLRQKQAVVAKTTIRAPAVTEAKKINSMLACLTWSRTLL